MSFVVCLIAARCLLVFMYFYGAFNIVPELSNWLEKYVGNYLPWLYGVGLMGFTHGYLGTVSIFMFGVYINICIHEYLYDYQIVLMMISAYYSCSRIYFCNIVCT